MVHRTRMLLRIVAALGAAMTASLATAETPTSEVRFQIRVDPRRGGEILCALYDKESEWLGRKCFRTSQVDPSADWVTCVFDAVPRGTYAAAALHDEDGNKAMTKGFLGLPKEGYTTSRDAQEKGFYPDWEDAVFSFRGEKPGVVVGHMHY